MTKICLVHNGYSSFVQRDHDILSKHFDVSLVGPKNKYVGYDKKAVVKYNDIIVSWFASYHTVPYFKYAKRLNKPCVVIVGGYDACDIKGYGMFSNPLRKRIVSTVYNNSTVILPVDESLRDVIVRYVPKVKDRIRVVPTGYDPTVFKPCGKKQDIVLTVAGVNPTMWWRKGLDRFVELAEYDTFFEDSRFVVVGKIDESMKHKTRGTPVEFTGWVDDAELLRWYQRSKVYCQLSVWEGLPNGLCEAMLCGCVPVGTRVCGIPLAIGDTGYIVEDKNSSEIVPSINRALRRGIDGQRERIMELFPVERREKALLEVLDDL